MLNRRIAQRSLAVAVLVPALMLTTSARGQDAVAAGLVHEVHPAAEIETVSLELAAAIAANAPLSMTGNKRAIETLARFTYLVKMPVVHQVGLYPPMAVLDYAEIIE